LVLVISIKDIRTELVQKEEQAVSDGIPAISDVTPSSFLHLGLDIEEHQCVLLYNDCYIATVSNFMKY